MCLFCIQQCWEIKKIGGINGFSMNLDSLSIHWFQVQQFWPMKSENLWISYKHFIEFCFSQYQGGSRHFNFCRNFSKSRWNITEKSRWWGYIFIFFIFIVFLLTDIFNFSKSHWNFKCSNFCHWFLYVLQKKSQKKSLIFEKFQQEFSHIPKADYLPGHSTR